MARSSRSSRCGANPCSGGGDTPTPGRTVAPRTVSQISLYATPPVSSHTEHGWTSNHRSFEPISRYRFANDSLSSSHQHPNDVSGYTVKCRDQTHGRSKVETKGGKKIGGKRGARSAAQHPCPYPASCSLLCSASRCAFFLHRKTVK